MRSSLQALWKKILEYLSVLNWGRDRWIIFMKSFCFLFPSLAAATFIVFYIVFYFFFSDFEIRRFDSPINYMGLFYSYDFHEIYKYPSPYLGSLALVSAFIGAAWTAFLAPDVPKFKTLQLFLLPWMAVFVAGAAWGFVWSNINWPTQNFGTFDAYRLFRETDIGTGLSMSVISAAQSYPVNVLGYAVYIGLLAASRKMFVKAPSDAPE